MLGIGAGCVVEQDDKPKFENWLRPREALTVLGSAYSKEDVARHLLLERLSSGAITAIAEAASWTGLAGAKPHQGLTTIPNDFWRDYYRYQTGFWDSGDLLFNLGHFRGSFNSVSVRFQGIRFDPGAIQKLAGAAENRIQATVNALNAAAPAAKAEEPAQKGKPVSPAALAAWYEAYKLAYPDESEDAALESARRMFPDKSITRKSIRDLRGPRAMGRPKNAS
jgi:hypothetical protein